MSQFLTSRTSGILLHPTSLPSPYGIGDFGDQARAFIDFLSDAGQTLWQILPLTPTGYGDSPYQSVSAFAGNPLLIDPRALAAEGLLQTSDTAAAETGASERVDFEFARSIKTRLLHQAFENFRRERSPSLVNEFVEFCSRSAWWLDNYSLFQSLKNAQTNRAWTAWDLELKLRVPRALEKARAELTDEIARQKFLQFLFHRQWQALRDYARQRQVRIIGDLPIFVAHDSVDVWANRELFKLDEDGKPTVVAGVPPDYFSETGQLWGNPLYDWDRLRATKFKWWIDRVRWSLELFDVVRIDHFRGFVACWEIPAGEPTAINGTWVDVSGRELFQRLKTSLADLSIIAEDLGVITPEVHRLREDFGLPGMRVLQFAFDGNPSNPHLPENYSASVVAYTGSHDTDTTIGWFQNFDGDKQTVLDYFGSTAAEINWSCIQAVFASVASAAIVPLQDVLGLSSEGRMNQPGTTKGNWGWRYLADQLRPAHSSRLLRMTKLYDRIGRRSA